MAFITTPEVRAIRNTLKETFPKLKFSVTKDHHTSVNVSILSGNVDFDDLFRDATRREASINEYHLDQYGDHSELFGKILNVIKTAPGTAEGGREWFDKSDIQSDYFNTAFYIHLRVGKWDKDYVQKG